MRSFCLAGLIAIFMLCTGSAFGRGVPNHVTGASHHVQPMANNGRHGGTPHGWSEGKKTGWRGSPVPPGQLKKHQRQGKRAHRHVSVRDHDVHRHPRRMNPHSAGAVGKPSAAIPSAGGSR